MLDRRLARDRDDTIEDNNQGGVIVLVLSRKERERIRLGDQIVVTVIRVSGDKVRLGIQAPKDVLVLRDELEPFEEPSEQVGEVELMSA